MAPQGTERRLAATLAADVVGYSRLMSEDEQGTIQTLHAYREAIGTLVEQHRGRVVDFRGDDLLAEFPNALDAVQCAVEIQGVLRVRNQSLAENRRMLFRIGVHLGDITAEGERIYGDGVNIAARLEALAEPGGVCVSATVHEQVHRRLEVVFEDLGEHEVKNIPDPVHVYRVGESQTTTKAVRSRPLIRRAATLAGLVVALAAGAAAVYLATRQPSPSGPPLTSIAVLPFDDMSPGGDQEYFADGMAEELIAMLSGVPDLRVVARTSAFAFKGKQADVRTIGGQLNVGSIVEGSVRKAGEQLRITAQLIRVSDGFHLWSETYDRRLDDVFQVQEEISRSIVDALRVRLASAAPLEKTGPRDMRAYELYLSGRHFLNRRTPQDMLRGREYFREALEIDPGYAPAHAALAEAGGLFWFYGIDRTDAALVSAVEAANRAIAIDPASVEAHVSLGLLADQRWSWEEAEAAYGRALELNPGYALAHVRYASHLMFTGRVEAAQVHAQRAVELDPLSPAINRAAGVVFLFGGDSTRAIERLEKVIELVPQDALAAPLLSQAYAAAGREAEAVEATLAAYPAEAHPDLRAAYERSGYAGLERRTLELEAARSGKECLDFPEGVAAWWARMKEPERALHCLEVAVDEHRTPILLADPAFAEISSDPRFTALLRRMNLAD